MATTYRTKIYDFCKDNNGLLSTRDASKIGVPAVELRKLAQRGALERVGHGTYRISHYPQDENMKILEALKLAGPESYVVGESVLALLDLGTFNPRKLHIATPVRVRKQLPNFVTLHSSASSNVNTEVHKQIRCQKVSDAFGELVGTAQSDRLLEAALEAHEKNYISTIEMNLITQLIEQVQSIKS